MPNQPNVVMRGGPADGQRAYVPVLGEPMSVEDVGGGSITYVASDRLEDDEGIELRVYVPKA